MIDRRTFLAGTGVVLLAAPLSAEAQQAGAPYRIGYLSSSATIFEPFRNAMRELGYIEGRNLVIGARLAAGKIERLPALAAELVSARVDVIAAVSPPAIQAAKEATTTIPIVMAFISVTQSRADSSRASTDPAATSPAWRLSPTTLPGSALPCSRKCCHARPAWRCSLR
jgi:ABC transporter substrate binding protein